MRAVLLAVVLAGCASWHGGGAATPSAQAPLVLRVDGDAGDRTAAVHALEQATRRHVELADDAAGEALLRDLAARERGALRRYDWREPRCAAQVDALAAARVGADAVYRLALREGAGRRGMLFRRTGPMTGEMAVRAFDGKSRGAQTAVAGDDVDAAVAAGVASLPAPPPARWDVVADGLVKAGCPFLALAVQDLRGGPGSTSVRARALAAIGRTAAPRKAVASAAEPEPPTPSSPEPAATSSSRFSCEALCDIHMVEVCNKDRTLWNQHLVAWERTSCGLRRSESFLVECYRRQRISGTFHDACVVPCERSPEGRNALLEMLQGAGCLRGGGPS